MGLIAISIGAGLRRSCCSECCSSLVHAFVVDLLRFSSLIGTLLAIILSAVLFALYHPPVGPEATYTTSRAFFTSRPDLLRSGLRVQGFGIVVAVRLLRPRHPLPPTDRVDARYTSIVMSTPSQPDPSRVSLLALDCDGVLTDGTIGYDEHGVERKFFFTFTTASPSAPGFEKAARSSS